MIIQYEYNDELNGAKIIATGDNAYAISSPNDVESRGTWYAVSKNDYAIGTGVYFRSSDGTIYWCQTRSGYWINAINTADGNSWTAYKDAVSKLSYSQTDAQKYVNKVIECNKQIIANNILCARFANRLTAQQKNTLYNLQKRLDSRNNSLLKDGMVQNVTTDYPQGYVYLQSYLDSFMASGGVGSVSITVTIVIAAVVIASLSTAAYFAYKSYATEAEQDLKYSKSLTAALTSKLTEAEYKQLMDETKGILTKAKILSSLKGSNKALLAIAAALGCYFIYERVKP